MIKYKELKDWQKGMFIGAIIGLILNFTYILVGGIFGFIAWILGVGILCGFEGSCLGRVIVYGWFVLPLMYGILGGLIVVLIRRYKQRKK